MSEREWWLLAMILTPMVGMLLLVGPSTWRELHEDRKRKHDRS